MLHHGYVARRRRRTVRCHQLLNNREFISKCPVSVWHDRRSCCVLYLCIGRAQALSARWMAAPTAGPEEHTYYVINPRATGAGGESGRAAVGGGPRRPQRGPRPGAPYSPGFLVPAPHGHSLRTELRVVPPPVAPRPASTSHLSSELREAIDP